MKPALCKCSLKVPASVGLRAAQAGSFFFFLCKFSGKIKSKFLTLEFKEVNFLYILLQPILTLSTYSPLNSFCMRTIESASQKRHCLPFLDVK